MQVGVPVAQDVVPFLHGFDGWHERFAVHETQLPAEQTRFVPQAVPSECIVPVAVHVGTPDAHASLPPWQGFVGWQVAPSTQAMHEPIEHTWFMPHGLPSPWLPEAMHTETPVAHEVSPSLHASLAVHALPAAHEPQTPRLHTLSVPQLVPVGSASPLAVQPMVGVRVEVPLWHGSPG